MYSFSQDETKSCIRVCESAPWSFKFSLLSLRNVTVSKKCPLCYLVAETICCVEEPVSLAAELKISALKIPQNILKVRFHYYPLGMGFASGQSVTQSRQKIPCFVLLSINFEGITLFACAYFYSYPDTMDRFIGGLTDDLPKSNKVLLSGGST